jgi:NTE family protein
MNDGNSNNLRIGLALGSGSSRGWSHIGIINALSEIGVIPEIICGCSVGALVGASYAADNLDKLERWVSSLTKLEVARFFELNLSLRGFINTERLHAFLQKYVCNEDAKIENLAKVFATVSTDLETGREIWFTKGSVIDSVWASISMPGLFPPIRNQGRWMVDGGLVNPVPVSVCRALGADIVIAVNLNGDISSKHFQNKPITRTEGDIVGTLIGTVKDYSTSLFPRLKSKNNIPGLLDTIAASINIMQDRITRSRMAGDPPDILLTPKLSHIGLLEFYRAKETIKEGKECVIRMLPEIRHVMGIA